MRWSEAETNHRGTQSPPSPRVECDAPRLHQE